jgi:hypothetical protein
MRHRHGGVLATLLLVSLASPIWAQQQAEQGESWQTSRLVGDVGSMTGIDWSAVPRTASPQANPDGNLKVVPNVIVPNNSTIYMSGNTTYTYTGNQARMTVNRVDNVSYTYTTGTLRLVLWLSTAAFPASGYQTATYSLGQLAPRTYYSTIDSGYVPFATPPTGCYYVSLLLEEYVNNQWVYDDFVAYSNRTSINGGCNPPGPTINTFTANPSTVNAGGASLLQWTTSNATSVSLDHGIGAVGTNTSMTITPAATTTYVLTAGNGSTQVVKNLTVTVTAAANPCSAPNTICLSNNRFAVKIIWKTKDASGDATPIKYTPDSGLYWFFGSDNIEVLLKILNACTLNNRYWIFSAATTDVEYTITVTDTLTGKVKTYFHAGGTPAPAITDTDAIPCS